jgi:hypothetical protein
MDILYYSNYCKHSQETLNTLVKSNLSDKISFICIDKRYTDPNTNEIKIKLEKGSEVLLPPNIKSVPTLLLVQKNFKTITGSEIIKYYHNDIKRKMETATNYNGEPVSYTLTNSGGSNIVSEQYTNYNLTANELSAKGESNNRNMYNYVSVNNDIHLINTPDDNYKADKVSSDLTIESLQQQRMNDLPESLQNKPPAEINFNI